MSDIKKLKVSNKFLRNGRWFVVLDKSHNGHATMPQAKYNWLLGNPSFCDTPDGYVIHHLDGDKTNDDITNLVIMQKHHHTAHHFKNKKLYSEVKIDIGKSKKEIIPEEKPKVHFWKNKGWLVIYKEKDENRELQRKHLFFYNGIKIQSEDDAHKIIKKIWYDNKFVDESKKRL